jgi:hypothetical protein
VRTVNKLIYYYNEWKNYSKIVMNLLYDNGCKVVIKVKKNDDVKDELKCILILHWLQVFILVIYP